MLMLSIFGVLQLIEEFDKAYMEKIIKRKNVLKTPWFNVESRTVTGLESPYFTLTLLDYVTILAITNDNRVILVKQYRPALEIETIELPSGHVEINEPPKSAARRELLEETGYEADDIKLLGILNPNTGRLNNKLWCYFAENVVINNSFAKEKGIERILYDIDNFNKIMIEGKLKHAYDLSVVALAILKKKITLNLTS